MWQQLLGERDSGAPPMARKSISVPQMKALVAVCGNRCAMHDVEPPCTGFSLVQGGRFLGEIAHIAAAEEGGKRWVAEMSDDERNANENLMILCPNHHTLIDSDEDTYTIEYLKEKKRVHEGASSTSGAFEPSEAVLGAIVEKTNQVMTVTNVNSPINTQTNATNASYGSGVPMIINGGHQTIVVQVTAPVTPPVADPLPVVAAIDRTLNLQIEERMVSLPILFGTAITADVPCYWLTFNEKVFVVQQNSVVSDIVLHMTTGATRESALSLFKSAQLFDDGRQYVETLFNEIRAAASAGNLLVAIADNADRYISSVPFDQLTAADFNVQNTVQFMRAVEVWQ